MIGVRFFDVHTELSDDTKLNHINDHQTWHGAVPSQGVQTVCSVKFHINYNDLVC